MNQNFGILLGFKGFDREIPHAHRAATRYEDHIIFSQRLGADRLQKIELIMHDTVLPG